MLVFVDESYRKADEPNAKSTFSAFLIQEERYRELDTKLFELKRHFWKCEHSYSFELKGRDLLSERAVKLPKNREFVSQLIFLCKEVDSVLFAVVQHGTLTLASESERLPNLYRALLRRVNNFMQKHHHGKASQHVIPTPFFCDSMVSPGIQIADAVAYCVNERYVGRRGYLEEYFQKFRDLTSNYQDPDEKTNLWGFVIIPPEESPILEPENNE